MIEILYEDNHLLVLNKKAGMPMQKSPHSDEDLENEAKLFIKKRDQKPGGVFLHAVHRLDKPVSGIAVFAKSKKALQRLNEAIREGLFKKTYFAIVEGCTKDAEKLTHYLHHGDFMAEVAREEKENYKKAILSYKKLKEGKDNSLLEIDLVSGRYHQIRAQLAFIGHPIYYDTKYGGKAGDYEGILLHHGKISFPHPVKTETVLVEAPLPKEFFKCVNLF